MPDFATPTEEWLSVLSRLWVAFDKPLDADRLQIYRQELGSIPLGLLELAVGRTIREHRFSNVPTIGDVWKALRLELGNPYDLQQSIEEWIARSFQNCIIRFKEGSVYVQTIQA